jgi:hypothetical protein
MNVWRRYEAAKAALPGDIAPKHYDAAIRAIVKRQRL